MPIQFSPHAEGAPWLCLIASSKVWRKDLAERIERLSGIQFRLVHAREELTVEALEQMEPDWIFFPHWSHLIPPEIHQRWRCVIFHMTDLPFGRGGSPFQNLLVATEPK